MILTKQNRETQEAIEYLQACYRRAGDACLSTYSKNQYAPIAALNNQDADIRFGACRFSLKVLLGELS